MEYNGYGREDLSSDLSAVINPKLVTRRVAGTESPDPTDPLASLAASALLSTAVLTEQMRPPRLSGRSVPQALDIVKGARNVGQRKGTSSFSADDVVTEAVDAVTAQAKPSRPVYSPRYSHVSSVIKKLIEGEITAYEAHHASSSRRTKQQPPHQSASSRSAPARGSMSVVKKFQMSNSVSSTSTPRLRISSSAPRVIVSARQRPVIPSSRSVRETGERYISPRGPITPPSRGNLQRLHAYRNTPSPQQRGTMPMEETVLERKPKQLQPQFSQVPRCAAAIPDHRRPSPRQATEQKKTYVTLRMSSAPASRNMPPSTTNSLSRVRSIVRSRPQMIETRVTPINSTRHRTPAGSVTAVTGVKDQVELSARHRVPAGSVTAVTGVKDQVELSARRRVPAGSVTAVTGVKDQVELSARHRTPAGSVTAVTGVKDQVELSARHRTPAGSVTAVTGVKDQVELSARHRTPAGSVTAVTVVKDQVELSARHRTPAGSVTAVTGVKDQVELSARHRTPAGSVTAVTGVKDQVELSARRRVPAGSVTAVTGVKDQVELSARRRVPAGSVTAVTGVKDQVELSARRRVPAGSVTAVTGVKDQVELSARHRVPAGSVTAVTGVKDQVELSARHRTPAGSVTAVTGVKDQVELSARRRVPAGSVSSAMERGTRARTARLRELLADVKVSRSRRASSLLSVEDGSTDGSVVLLKPNSVDGNLTKTMTRGIKPFLLFDIKPPRLSVTDGVPDTAG